MVEDVEGFHAELEIGSLSEMDVLKHREIRVPSGRPHQRVALNVAKLTRGDILKGGQVEIPVRGRVGGVGADASRVEPVADPLNNLATGIPAYCIDGTA